MRCAVEYPDHRVLLGPDIPPQQIIAGAAIHRVGQDTIATEPLVVKLHYSHRDNHAAPASGRQWWR